MGDDSGLAPSEVGHFELVESFRTEYSPNIISKYISRKSGLSVTIVQRESPKVLGLFTLATEILDDSGAPHTLEHLCFMGSKKYPYRGVLDKVATRAYSNTNAFTAPDHTAYILDSAGWKGFAQVMPMYLDHVMRPTITEDGCITEVHHIDGAGADAGVVYSEMQAIQNTQGFLEQLRTSRLLYPEGSGYRYETGGMMEQLRVLTPERILKFHQDMYQLRNLSLILVGPVHQEELFHLVGEFEEAILQDHSNDLTPWKRPWVESDPVPSIVTSVTDIVEFPEEDESMGEIMVTWFGPDCNDSVARKFKYHITDCRDH